MIVGVSVSGWGTACRAPTDDRDRTAQRRRRRSLSSASPHRRVRRSNACDGAARTEIGRARPLLPAERSTSCERCDAPKERSFHSDSTFSDERSHAHAPCAATALRGGRRAAIRHRPSSSARLRSCGLKPSLSVWKPLRGWRVCHPSLCREGRRVDPARRACPTSDRAYGL